ncbi:BRO-N domain-containing protein [Pseudomonas aeruginosa]|uniref:BRO-N domain-containing protein n=1 Tax=Pseudomonas aeruginosa TaxID=287 RepID=UPI003FCF7FB3
MNLIPYDFNSKRLQVLVDENGEPWFIAMEVAEILGYSDAYEMTKRLDEDEKSNRQIAGLGTASGGRGVTTINESGLYSSIIGSNKPEAKPFKRWVTHDVLPPHRQLLHRPSASASPHQRCMPDHRVDEPHAEPRTLGNARHVPAARREGRSCRSAPGLHGG